MFSAAVVASPLHNPSRLATYVSEFTANIRDIPFRGVLTEPSELEGVAAVVLVATGGTEHTILETVRRSKLRYVLLVYHDFENSLPAVMEVTPALRKYVHVEIAHLSSMRSLVEHIATASRAALTLSSSKLLVFGSPSPWLVYSSGSDDALRSKLGIEVEYVDMRDLYTEYDRVSDDFTGRQERFKQLVNTSLIEVEHISKSFRLYLAFNKIARERGARAISVRCFDLIKDMKLAGCLALSLLLDDFLVAGCEADIPATATMMILKELSGRPPWIANVVSVSRGRVELAHCTIATSITHSFTLTTHFESGLPVAISGIVRKNSEATIAKYDPKRNLIRAARGVVTESEPKYGARCRTQLTLEVSEKFSDRLLGDPLGAHVVVSFTNVLKPLEILAKILDVDVEVFE